MTGLFLRRGYRVKLLFEILDACECRGVQALGMGWPTKQSFHNIAILGFLHLHVCSFVYRFPNCLLSEEIQTVWFLLDIIRLDETGSRNQRRRDFVICEKLNALTVTFQSFLNPSCHWRSTTPAAAIVFRVVRSTFEGTPEPIAVEIADARLHITAGEF